MIPKVLKEVAVLLGVGLPLSGAALDVGEDEGDDTTGQSHPRDVYDQLTRRWPKIPVGGALVSV
jgi:hypothetical protein